MKQCDNVGYKGKHNNVKKVKLTEDFNQDVCF